MDSLINTRQLSHFKQQENKTVAQCSGKEASGVAQLTYTPSSIRCYGDHTIREGGS